MSTDDDADMDQVEPTPDDLSALPARLRQQIDRAFDRALLPRPHIADSVDDGGEPKRKRRRLNGAASGSRSRSAPGSDIGGGFVVDDAPGGFILDEPPDPEPGAAGGFLPSTPTPSSRPSAQASAAHIPLSAIPRALQYLGLPAEDEDVLATFREAAAGWGGDAGGGEGGGEGETGVSREDWRAVCAVLLAQREDGGDAVGDGEDDGEGEGGDGGEDAIEQWESDLTEEDDEDVWRPQGAEYDADDPDAASDSDRASEYHEAATPPSAKRKDKGKGRARARPRITDLADLTYGDLAHKKQAEVRDAFALFFDNEEEHGPVVTRRIRAADLVRVAKVLHEKLSNPEIEEMLELFSGAPDGSLGIQEFSKIMIQSNML